MIRSPVQRLIRPRFASPLRPYRDPAIDLDFVNGGFPPGLLTFDRNATKIIGRAGDGQLVSLAADKFATDHDANGNPLGLLLEGARTNICLRSEALDNAAWTKQNATIDTGDSIVAPDGSSSAFKFNDNTVETLHQIFQTVTVTAGSTNTVSLIVKAGDNDRIFVSGRDTGGANGYFVEVDLSAGTVVNEGAFGTGTKTDAGIIDLGNGWYRPWVSGVVGGDATSVRASAELSGAGASLYIGTGTGVYPWAFQHESGAFPSSYIPTTSAAVERALDTLKIGPGIPWFNPLAGTMIVEFRVPTVSGIKYLASFADDTALEKVDLFIDDELVKGHIVDGGVTQASITADGTVSAETVAKAALAWAANDFAVFLDGNTPGTDAAGTLPTVNQINLGTRLDETLPLFGHLRRFRYWPHRLSNDDLKRLTA